MNKLQETGPAKELRKRINWLEDQLHSLKIMNGVGYTARRLATGTTLQIKIPKVEGTQNLFVQKFRIISFDHEVLTCRKVDASGAEVSQTQYTVYRPIKTRIDDGFPADYVAGTVAGDGDQGRNFIVTITSGSIQKALSVSQVISPSYVAGDIIFAISGIDGSTYGDAEEETEWLDLNVDARHWRYTERLIEVCVNDELQYMMVLGSATST